MQVIFFSCAQHDFVKNRKSSAKHNARPAIAAVAQLVFNALNFVFTTFVNNYWLTA